jgi:hypothetical protein
MFAFCRNEFAYYDALASAYPNRIDPLDVLATVAMNSRVDTAKKVRAVHEGLANRCDPLVPLDLALASGFVSAYVHHGRQTRWLGAPHARVVFVRRAGHLLCPRDIAPGRPSVRPLKRVELPGLSYVAASTSHLRTHLGSAQLRCRPTAPFRTQCLLAPVGCAAVWHEDRATL